jgi:SPP1 gp7 family putative phage head morphogenesis protein
MPDNPLLSQVSKYRARLDKQSEADLKRLIAAYGNMSQRIRDQVDVLLMAIEHSPNVDVKRLPEYKRLVEAINTEYERFDNYLETELDTITSAARAQARLDAPALIAAALVARGLDVKPSAVPVSVAPSVILSPGSPHYKRLHELAPLQAEQLITKLLDGINGGLPYKSLANNIIDDLGLGLSDALRWARTMQMETYRETSHNTMLENGAVVDGWTWWAQVDEFTCESCSENHGTFHSADESLNDLTSHIWNCRCVELPHVIGDNNPVTDEPIE